MTFEELLAAPGVREVLVLRSAAVGFLALHGGSHDVRTDVIALEAARASGASAYAVVLPPSVRVHLPSTRYRPAASRLLGVLFSHVEVVVSLHGYQGRHGAGGPEASRASSPIFVGGATPALRHLMAHALGRALPRWPVVADLGRIPVALRGIHPDNPVNLARGGGVQVELPAELRVPGTSGPRRRALIEALAGVAASLGTVTTTPPALQAQGRASAPSLRWAASGPCLDAAV